jgi:hypothetical protein
VLVVRPSCGAVGGLSNVSSRALIFLQLQPIALVTAATGSGVPPLTEVEQGAADDGNSIGRNGHQPLTYAAGYGAAPFSLLWLASLPPLRISRRYFFWLPDETWVDLFAKA